MKTLSAVATSLIGALMVLLIPPDAQAVPAFARQLGVPCSTCHFQHFPELNAFGRNFKQSGFTLGGANLIEADHFSLPMNMNAAIFTNIRYQKTDGHTPSEPRNSNNGEWIIPGETSLFIGGRVSPNVGALVEGDVGGAGTAEGSGFLASIKVPLIKAFDNGPTVGVVPFSAGLGPAYAYETMNTGAVGNHFMNLVHINSMSAAQYIQAAYNPNGAAGSVAEGIGAYISQNNFFATIARWSPNHSIVDAFSASATPNSNYARAAYTPVIGGWDTGIGVQYFGGTSDQVSGSTTEVADITGGCSTSCPVTLTDQTVYTTYHTEAWIVDAQAQGTLFNRPTGFYFSYGQVPHSKVGEAQNIYNPYTETKKAASIAAEMGVLDSGRVAVQMAYLWAKTGNADFGDDRAATVGVSYTPWLNVQLLLLQTWYSGSAHSQAALDSGDPFGLGGMLDASGTGNALTTLNLALGF